MIIILFCAAGVYFLGIMYLFVRSVRAVLKLWRQYDAFIIAMDRRNAEAHAKTERLIRKTEEELQEQRRRDDVRNKRHLKIVK